jgi:hypothetical protein
MSNPFHSFHVQKGGIPLKKLSKHYRKLSKNKSHKFQPLMFQEKEDLVVPIDLLHVPHHQCHAQQAEDYYVYPEHHQQAPVNGTLEIIQFHTVPQHSYEHPPVIDDEMFEQLFQHISKTPFSEKKKNKSIKKDNKKKRKSRKLKKL